MAIIDVEDISRVKLINPEGKVIPLNILIYSSSGGGKTLAEEQIADYYHRNGFTVISLTDVKDELELGFCMFEPTAQYHKANLRTYGCPTQAKPTKIYHPFTFNIPHHKLPNINFYTIDIKSLTRQDYNFLAESPENKKSIQIILEQLNNLKKHEGIHHLVFYAENQTESMANITKTGVRFRSDNPNDFYTKSKIGTEKTSSELLTYLKPFIIDYTIAPSNCKHNIDIEKLINDQQHYHIFTSKWIKDKRLKSFYILHLLNEIINNSDKARYPICLIIEEVRYLVPNTAEGYTTYLAEEIKNNMTRMRNMGKGYASILTTQVYRDVNDKVIDTINEIIIGRLTSMKEYEFVGKTMRLTTTEINLLKSLQVGQFVIRAKEQYADEVTLQKVKFFMPPHSHKEVGDNFFTTYEKNYPTQMRQYTELIDEMKTIKNQIEEEVSILKDKENQSKKDQLKIERESKLDKEKMKLKIEMAKIQKKTEKTEDIDEKLRDAIYNDWIDNNKTQSLSDLARKYDMYLSDGITPNKMRIQRIIKKYQKVTLAPQENTTTKEDTDEKNTIAESYDDNETKDTE